MIDQAPDTWANDQDVVIPQDVPTPLLWRILVCPMRPRQVSKGGIHIVSESQDAQKHLNYVGRVVKMGPLAGKSEKFARPAPEPRGVTTWGNESAYDVNEGDFVIYGRYAGQPLEFKGVRLLLINDDEVLAKVSDPEALKIYV